MMYHELSIHQRITAKANAQVLYPFYTDANHKNRLLSSVSRFDPGRYCPATPLYAIHFKTNEREP